VLVEGAQNAVTARAVFFAIESTHSTTRIVCSADHFREFDYDMRRISVVDASRSRLKFRQWLFLFAIVAD
jgi:hypothetical protein